jgi:hypothetical protein
MNWIQIAQFMNEFDLAVAKLKLEDEDIPFHVQNKQDRSFNDFGPISIFVEEENSEKAKIILNSSNE